MSSEQDKRPSLVPLGVFGSTPSAQPSPPASATSPGTVAAQPLPAKPLAPPPPAPPPPSAASPAPSSQPPADRPSFPKTLVGVPSLSPEAARANRGDFPAPPKWQGAAAYNAGAPPLRTSSGGPMPPGAQPPPAASSSALSGSAQPPSPFPLAKDVPALGRANLRSASAPVAAPPTAAVPAAAAARADDTEQELDLFDAIEEPASVAPSAPVVRVSARPAPPARPQPESNAGQPAQPATRSSIPPVIVPDFARKDPSEVNIALAAPAPAPTPAHAPAPLLLDEARAPAPRLAPVVAAVPRARVEVDPGAPLLGVIFVAAMLVLGVGGWLLTQGGFVRPRHPEVAASVSPAAKKAAPAIPVPPAEVPVAAPEAEPAVEAAVEPPSAAAAPIEPDDQPAAPPEPAPRSGASEPRPRRAEPAARPAVAADRPSPPPASVPRADSAPTLTITPQGHTPAPAGGAMPDTPTREDVTRALDEVRAQVSACTAGKHGVAEVDLTVLAAGDVSHVVVTGDFAGTPEGSCIAREVRAARFSPFLKPRFRLIYPFQL